MGNGGLFSIIKENNFGVLKNAIIARKAAIIAHQIGWISFFCGLKTINILNKLT